jgi:hypothetical protein
MAIIGMVITRMATCIYSYLADCIYANAVVRMQLCECSYATGRECDHYKFAGEFAGSSFIDL